MTAAQERIVLDHMDFVDSIARKQIHKSNQGRGLVRTVEFDDLVQLGRVALIECVASYDPAIGPFAAHAYKRVRGAMIDPHRRRNYDYELHGELHDGMRDTVEPVEEVIHRKQICRRVREALGSLSDEDQALVQARSVDGKTFSQISKSGKQGTTSTFYRSRCAHRRLRDALERRGLRR